MQAMRPRAESAPHGGQVFKSIWNAYEVVYGPQETRVYIYDIYHNPISVRGIQGGARMRVRSNGSEYRYPLQAPVGRDYLVMQVDLSRVRDGDMDVLFDLENLPNGEQRTVRFAQTFVMNAPAESGMSMRPVGRPMATGTGATGHVEHDNHAGHESHGDAKSASTRASSNVAVTTATSADSLAIQRQRTCPITGSPLGEHGAPLKLSRNGRTLFVCCQGCVSTVLQSPDAYLR